MISAQAQYIDAMTRGAERKETMDAMDPGADSVFKRSENLSQKEQQWEMAGTAAEEKAVSEMITM